MTAVGALCLANADTGSGNATTTAVGAECGRYATGANKSVMVGYQAGHRITGGDDFTFVGYQCGGAVDSNATTGQSNWDLEPLLYKDLLLEFTTLL